MNQPKQDEQLKQKYSCFTPIENTAKYNDCLDKLLNKLNDLLSSDKIDTDITSYVNIHDVLLKFLKIFNINDIKDYDYKKLEQEINLIHKQLQQFIKLYDDELQFYINVINDIFNMISIGNNCENIALKDNLHTILFSNEYNGPSIRLVESNKPFQVIPTNKHIKEIIKKASLLNFKLAELPEIYCDNDQIKTNITHDYPNIELLIRNTTNIPQDVSDMIKVFVEMKTKFPNIELPSENYIGGLDNLNQIDNLEINNNNNNCFQYTEITPEEKTKIFDKILFAFKNFSNILNETNFLIYTFIQSIISFIEQIEDKKILSKKLHEIYNHFEKGICLSTDLSSKFQNLLLINLIILIIDKTFLSFIYYIIVAQLEYNEYSIFNIQHKILKSIDYYIKLPNTYMYINKQHTMIQSNIILHINIILGLMMDLNTFFIPIDNRQFLSSVNLSLIICCTLRNVIFCPTEDIVKLVMSNILKTSNVDDQIIFKVESNDTLVDHFGNKIKFVVDNSITDKIVCNKIL